MATPDFILALREKIGTAPLWLTGVTAVVLRGDDEVLMVQRADSGQWTPVTGIIDPGEEPADAAVREVLEESGIVAVAERLVKAHVLPPQQYDNGDRVQYLDLVFRLRWVSGDPHPADGENTQARWFRLDELPELRPTMVDRIAAARSHDERARFTEGGVARP
ncbi:NUDIX domain-containing protein [Actinosynnema pretiosum subsp. pretiosum]|uniref:NUDIX hydrolase n=2 Tax=Actinosynnema TaxID=40566 RepID=C6WRQ4_ACTMD|nr:NUDIX domain-containing protein [Actinosynnema mirum]ACU36896.1 NUDIX hydrolase [Actinosynnema mirum DSM 43827]AXX30365.1 MutT/NUDIX family protein [Actinosynnema pretiosum subsp. pretiosum]QUF05486.1 NUDIX domain-containing protein [Actinosynnema pretiosum subsp. pretiosum]